MGLRLALAFCFRHLCLALRDRIEPARVFTIRCLLPYCLIFTRSGEVIGAGSVLTAGRTDLSEGLRDGDEVGVTWARNICDAEPNDDVRAPRRLSHFSKAAVLVADGTAERPLVMMSMVSVVDFDRLSTGLTLAGGGVLVAGADALIIASAV